KSLILDSFNLIPVVLGPGVAKWVMFLLAVAAFPPACFSAFIAANSFKTTLPKVSPFISVGIGAAVSIFLGVTGYAGKVTGPRAGFNPAGWISWALGFVVGILPNLGVDVPAAPVLAFIVGAVVYYLCAKIGLESPVVPLPGSAPQPAKPGA